ncbi:MAG: hypothetical protein J6386_10665 [Candidatus Synoicihabitans palmerolidicus]|nr:hypothetical protein [Candidatus Synoicihabitans palmerolidicus]
MARGEAERGRIAGVSWLADRRLEVDNDLKQARARLAQLGAEVMGETSAVSGTPDSKAVPD